MLANPSPATRLNNSLLELTLPADYEALASGFTLTRRDQVRLVRGLTGMLQNAEGKMLLVRMVVNLPDHRPETRPGLPANNVRPANLFGVEVAGGSLYVVDASFNQVYKVNPETGEYSTFTVFPPKPNPLPVGPPVVEAVPDSIRLFGGQLLVTSLTGFPFPQNFAEVRKVDLVTGAHHSFITGLTAAIDVLPVPVARGNNSFYVLEYSANFLAQPQAPGRLKLFYPRGTGLPPEGGSSGLDSFTLLSNLISPTSIARDADTGDLFITEIFTGRIIRYDLSEEVQ